MIESGESEQIWQKAIREQGRGQVRRCGCKNTRGPQCVCCLTLGPPPLQVLDTVREIQERHSAVKDLERQLLGLHQIFLDMAVLVEAQGEMLDNIETQARRGCGACRPSCMGAACAHSPCPHTRTHTRWPRRMST